MLTHLNLLSIYPRGECENIQVEMLVIIGIKTLYGTKWVSQRWWHSRFIRIISGRNSPIYCTCRNTMSLDIQYILTYEFRTTVLIVVKVKERS